MRCLVRGWLDSKDSFLSPHCALRGPQRAAWQNCRGSSTGRRGVARPSSHVVTRLPDAPSGPLGLSGWDLMGHWTSLECHGEFPGKALSMSWSPLELLKIRQTGHRRTPELLACAVPAPLGICGGPRLGTDLPVLPPASSDSESRASAREVPGPGLRPALAGREADGVAGRSRAWPAALGTCHSHVFAQRAGRGSRMLSVGPRPFRVSRASCRGWQPLALSLPPALNYSTGRSSSRRPR